MVPAGDTVLLCPASAHRDPSRHPDPDRFDIGRRDKAHLALGHGLHHCLGAPLARLQIRVALDVIIRTFPTLALSLPAEKLPWRRTFRSHALKRLSVTLGTR
ncbi:hypothetical protein GCM10010275_42410 [Streptomyces litmocidini]|nr:hypothetical protein GCM10010275_42410 [Streptomyces litmocidini]